MPEAEKLLWRDAFPCLHDRTSDTGIDPHYFYQNIWAMKRIKASGVGEHIDVGSLASFVGLLSTIVKVTFIDIRPLKVDLDNFDSRAGTILDLPLADDSVASISCLHVAEHIGLGRYGDPLDSQGTRKACKELARVLAPGGFLYFSLPVGKPCVCFNAHRIHAPGQILDYFDDLEMVDFSGVTDQGQYLENISPSDFETANYACGMFCFTK
jgi:SAM-dependent methyltransferase